MNSFTDLLHSHMTWVVRDSVISMRSMCARKGYIASPTQTYLAFLCSFASDTFFPPQQRLSEVRKRALRNGTFSRPHKEEVEIPLSACAFLCKANSFYVWMCVATSTCLLLLSFSLADFVLLQRKAQSSQLAVFCFFHLPNQNAASW